MTSGWVLQRAAAMVALTTIVGCGGQSSGTPVAATSPPQTSSAVPGDTGSSGRPTRTVVAPSGSGTTVVPDGFAPRVVWKGDMLIVTAFGSSTCPPLAQVATVVDRQTIRVAFGGTERGVPCTDDFGPSRSRVAAPSGGIDLEDDVHALFETGGSPRKPIPVRLVDPVLG